MDESSDKDGLLSEHAESDQSSGEPLPGGRWQRFRPQFLSGSVIALLVVALVGTNVAWYSVKQIGPQESLQDMHYFAPGADKSLIGFFHDWEGLVDTETEEYRYADEKWKGLIPPGGGIVQVPLQFVADWNLPHSSTANDNSSEMVYTVGGYHQLHCLRYLRDVIYQLNGTTITHEEILWDHILHCIEAVRQALVCFSDPTLVNLGTEWPRFPDGQRHVCRNTSALFEWTKNHQGSRPEGPREVNTNEQYG